MVTHSGSRPERRDRKWARRASGFAGRVPKLRQLAALANGFCFQPVSDFPDPRHRITAIRDYPKINLITLADAILFSTLV